MSGWKHYGVVVTLFVAGMCGLVGSSVLQQRAAEDTAMAVAENESPNQSYSFGAGLLQFAGIGSLIGAIKFLRSPSLETAAPVIQDLIKKHVPGELGVKLAGAADAAIDTAQIINYLRLIQNAKPEEKALLTKAARAHIDEQIRDAHFPLIVEVAK